MFAQYKRFLRQQYAFFLIVLCLLGILVYSNTLNVPFLFDDTRNVLHSDLQLNQLSWRSLTAVVHSGELRTRPVANLSFALNYFFTGSSLPGYHAVNIALHILSAFLLYLLLRKTLFLPVNKIRYGSENCIAELTALIWVVHPLATQSVTYIVQRMNVLAVLFYILSLYLYVAGRENWMQDHVKQKKRIRPYLLFVLSALSAVLAMGSKEMAVTIPVFIILYEWFFFQDLNRTLLKKQLPWFTAIVFVLGGLAYIYLNGHPISYIVHGCDHRDFTLQERLLTQPRVIWHYISLLLYPNPGRLVFDYDFPVSVAFFRPVTTFFAMAGVAIAVFLALILAQKERLLSFCIFWFFGNLVIESSVICLEMVFEHRTYLPSTFFIFFWVLLCSRLLRSRLLLFSLFSAVIGIFAFWTWQRNLVWQDSVTFWQDSVEKYPHKARSRTDLSTAYYETGQQEKAEKELLSALKINSDYALANHNLAIILADQGRYPEAINYEQKALQQKPNQQDIYHNLAVFYEKIGQISEAEKYLQQGIRFFPDSSYFPVALASLYIRQNHLEKALFLLLRAHKHFPENIEVLESLAEAYEQLGRGKDAILMYGKILAVKPDSPLIHAELGRILASSGRSRQALQHYSAAVEQGLEDALVFYNIGNLYLRSNQLGTAISNYRKALRLSGDNPDILNNMGLAYARQGKWEQAAKLFSLVLTIDPDNTLAGKNLLLVQQKMKMVKAAPGGKK